MVFPNCKNKILQPLTLPAKGLVAELTSPHAQSAWGLGGKGFELWG